MPLEQLEKDSRRVLLVELMVEPKPAGQYRIGQVEVDYDVPQLGLTGQREKVDLILQITGDQALTRSSTPR